MLSQGTVRLSLRKLEALVRRLPGLAGFLQEQDDLECPGAYSVTVSLAPDGRFKRYEGN